MAERPETVSQCGHFTLKCRSTISVGSLLLGSIMFISISLAQRHAHRHFNLWRKAARIEMYGAAICSACLLLACLLLVGRYKLMRIRDLQFPRMLVMRLTERVYVPPLVRAAATFLNVGADQVLVDAVTSRAVSWYSLATEILPVV